MTATELRDLFRTPDFQEGLRDISGSRASIMQERPIVYLLARCLWKRGTKFELEDKHHDLSLDGQRIEFKFNYDRCGRMLARQLAQYGDDLPGMWRLVQAKKLSKSWGVIPKIYDDACVRKPQPNILVWIICSRDLSQVAPADLDRICGGRDQVKYNATRPSGPGGDLPEVFDSFLAKLNGVRPFTLLKEDIPTNGDFPSTYHFRICDFGGQGTRHAGD